MELCRQISEPCKGALLQGDFSSKESDRTVDAISNLPAFLRKKILSRAWTDMAAVANEYAKTLSGPRLISSGDFDKDWRNLEERVWKLPRQEKEKALTAFYTAVITVLGHHTEQKRCATKL